MSKHPSEKLAVIFYRVNRNYQYLMALHLKPFHITPEQWNVLKHLQEQDGLTQKDLTYMADKDKTTVTRIIENLVERGAVTKSVNSEDRRSYRIYLTDTGKEIIRQVQPIPDRLNREVCRGMPVEQIIQLKQTLDLLQEQIRFEIEQFNG
ncbi:MarR family winged helix-turn-helix transcriptional regulator [Paenibacillus tianjinensis]|uniref:MarR family transcriptional regulator n=1 Tax=Paenibacillus tianjinensis TaxID=2810347 RepID=A0ABX7LH12_9BACL|nr:MarR family transcriptional regulator [Paenibacillus tianjinensis]QSF46638.1 MarR family transcriptional regulator [Paenibacillus tianjinensis]